MFYTRNGLDQCGQCIKLLGGGLKVRALHLVVKNGHIFVEGSPSVYRTVEDTCRELRAQGVLTNGSGTFNPPTPEALDMETGAGIPYGAYSYATQMVEVEVDTETGQFDILRVVAAHDVGRAINPMSIEGQIEGGVVMGLGRALFAGDIGNWLDSSDNKRRIKTLRSSLRQKRQVDRAQDERIDG